jgi:hypothetical protein
MFWARSRIWELVRHRKEDDDRHQKDVKIRGLHCELPDERICSTGGSWNEPTAFGDGIQCNAT